MAIAQEGEMNITALSRRVGMDHSSVDGHCEILRDAGLICEKRYGKIRILEADFMKFEVKLKKGLGAEIIVDNVRIR